MNIKDPVSHATVDRGRSARAFAQPMQTRGVETWCAERPMLDGNFAAVVAVEHSLRRSLNGSTSPTSVVTPASIVNVKLSPLVSRRLV